MTEIRVGFPITLNSPAKINLGLEITGRRADGYHEVVTILQMVDLNDTILIEPDDHLSYESPVTSNSEADLLLRAVRAFEGATGFSVRAKISLRKRIPDAAGLGGGSSNAGTILKWLGSVATVDDDILWNIAASLGTDTPFFLNGPAAIATGTGNRIQMIDHNVSFVAVAVTPVCMIEAKTATMYRSLRASDFSDGATTCHLANKLREGGIRFSRLTNTFARAARQIPEISALWAQLERAGAEHIIPAGAGPTLLAFCSNDREAEGLLRRMREEPVRFAGILRPHNYRR